jgi:opacity protein-like surface antigen
MPFLFSFLTNRLLRISLVGVLAVPALGLLTAGEIELKSLNTVQNDPATKKKYGPYVGVFGGANNSQLGNVSIGGFKYSLNDRDNSAVFGFEVGKTWRAKKAPIAFSMDFEGSFMQTELSGALDPAVAAGPRGAAPPPVTNPLLAVAPTTTPTLPSDSTVAAYTADMNAAFFMVNATVSLDLWRYRARLGKFIAGLKPYIGGGFGGGQIWFRESYSISLAQQDDPTSTVLPSASPFVIDEFVSAWQWYGGIEYAWQDKYSVFAEYRQFHLGDLEDMSDFYTKGYTIGFRYRY